MKATGIIRRIDDLGRIVLPKEIRKSLKIKEGDMLEIYVQDSGMIMLQKYEPMDTLSKIADQYAEVLADITGYTVCIATDSYIISSHGPFKKEYIRKDLSIEVINLLNERINWSNKNDQTINITKDDSKNKYTAQIVVPIIDNGDVIGCIILISIDSNKHISDYDINVAKLVGSLLEKQME